MYGRQRGGRRKPPAGAQIDWTHPLAQALSFYSYFPPGAADVGLDLVSGRRADPSLATTTVSLPPGLMQMQPVVRDALWADADSRMSANTSGNTDIEITAAAHFYVQNQTTAFSGWADVFGKYDYVGVADNRGWNIKVSHGIFKQINFACYNNVEGGVALSQAVATGESWYACGTRRRAANDLVLYARRYQDNVRQKATNGLSGTWGNTSASLRCGGTGAGSGDMRVAVVAFWKRSLTEDEAWWFDEAPFDLLYVPVARRLLLPKMLTPAAGHLTLSGLVPEVQGPKGLTIPPGVLSITGAAPTRARGISNPATRISIRATLDAPAASWDLETPDVSLMTGDDDATTVRLAMGFVDGSDVAQLVNQIEAGRITGRAWSGSRPGLSVRVRGLDAMDRLMRTQRAIRYVPHAAPAVLEAVAPAEGEPEVQVKAGTWTARSIATDLLAGTGLALYWGVRDYTFHEEFSGVGPILSLLRQIVAPWDFAPLGVDIRAQASVIRVTQRVLSPGATVTKTMAAARCDIVQGERRRHPLIGAVVLEGRLESSRLTQAVDAEGGVVWLGGDDPDNELASRRTITVRTTPVEVRDAYDQVISLTEREERWRMPDGLLEWSREKVWQVPKGQRSLTQTTETEVFITLEPSIYGPRGPINQPLPRSSVTVIATLVDGALQETRREETGYTYDRQRFLKNETKSISERVLAEGDRVTFVEREKVTTTWRPEIPGWTRITEARERFDETGTPTGSTSTERVVSGYPPGGLRPPGSGALSDDPAVQEALADAELRPIRLTATISSDPAAIPVRYSNRNLSAADLAYQLALLTACSGVYERTVRFSGPAMPWLAVGDVLEITAYTPYVGASPMTLGPGLVRDLSMTYTRATAELRAEGEAVVYEAA